MRGAPELNWSQNAPLSTLRACVALGVSTKIGSAQLHVHSIVH